MGISLHRNVYSLDGRVLDATGSCPASSSPGGALCGGEIVAFARDRFSRFWRSLEQARRLGAAQESPGKAPGVSGTP